MIERLDHLNIRTGQLEAMMTWYGDVLGLQPGFRPNFGFPGAWLYAGEHALVHLVSVVPVPGDPGEDLKLEHGAFRATGYAAFKAKLEARGARMQIVKVPDIPVVQVNIWDPDGNHLHIDFDAAEVDPVDFG